jgi:hypothetical protein
LSISALGSTFILSIHQGFPMSTGASFIDYFITGDTSVTPPDERPPPAGLRKKLAGMSVPFTEKLVYMPVSYIPTDHAQVTGHVVELGRASASQTFTETAHRQQLYAPTAARATQASTDVGVPHSVVHRVHRGRRFIFACFSNYQKIGPAIFTTWMQLLQRTPHSVLWLQNYHAAEHATPNLKAEAAAHGVHPSRLMFTPQTEWINHTWRKSAADLVLDTSLKNGHTTVADALWAGVPIVSISGNRMGNRVGPSLLSAVGVGALTTHTLKDYTQLSASLANSNVVGGGGGESVGVGDGSTRPPRLAAVRARLESNRLSFPLFNTPLWVCEFERRLHAMWESSSAANAAAGDAIDSAEEMCNASTGGDEEDEEDEDERAGRVVIVRASLTLSCPCVAFSSEHQEVLAQLLQQVLASKAVRIGKGQGSAGGGCLLSYSALASGGSADTIDWDTIDWDQVDDEVAAVAAEEAEAAVGTTEGDVGTLMSLANAFSTEGCLTDEHRERALALRMDLYKELVVGLLTSEGELDMPAGFAITAAAPAVAVTAPAVAVAVPVNPRDDRGHRKSRHSKSCAGSSPPTGWHIFGQSSSSDTAGGTASMGARISSSGRCAGFAEGLIRPEAAVPEEVAHDAHDAHDAQDAQDGGSHTRVGAAGAPKRGSERAGERILEQKSEGAGRAKSTEGGLHSIAGANRYNAAGNELLLLHIGGKEKKEDWTIVNTNPGAARAHTRKLLLRPLLYSPPSNCYTHPPFRPQCGCHRQDGRAGLCR